MLPCPTRGAFSKNLEDVGELQLGKILLVLFYCAQALWCRFRYGIENLYYVPAPGKPDFALLSRLAGDASLPPVFRSELFFTGMPPVSPNGWKPVPAFKPVALPTSA